jgi:AcrR family transcriptional regulator
MAPQSTPNTAAKAGKPRRDSAATKSRLLAAATEEFAERGIAGARVDRISSAAQANKRLIYDYFRDKDGLFDAVADAYIDRIIDAVPIDADDLPAYAGRLFDYLLDNPDLLRVLTWARLERRLTPEALAKSAESYQRRLAAIGDAQREGKVTASFTPAQILALIESLAVGWLGTTMAFQAENEAELERERDAQRKAITEGLRRMLTNSAN